MPRRNGTTRRSVSVKGPTYARLRIVALQTGQTVTAVGEEILNQGLDQRSIRNFTVEEAESLRPKNGGPEPLTHPSKRANDARQIKETQVEAQEPKREVAPPPTPESPPPPPKPPSPPPEPMSPSQHTTVLADRQDEADDIERDAPASKEPTVAPARPKETPRGGGVHSF